MITFWIELEVDLITNNRDNNTTGRLKCYACEHFLTYFWYWDGTVKFRKFYPLTSFYLRIVRRPPLLDFSGGTPRSSSRNTIVPCSIFCRIIIVEPLLKSIGNFCQYSEPKRKGSLVSIVTNYRLHDRGFFSYPKGSGRLWCPPSLYSWYRGLFPNN